MDKHEWKLLEFWRLPLDIFDNKYEFAKRSSIEHTRLELEEVFSEFINKNFDGILYREKLKGK